MSKGAYHLKPPTSVKIAAVRRANTDDGSLDHDAARAR